MALETENALDTTNWQILRALQEDARLSYSELGRRVGLSSPAVVDRIRRMEDAGIITAYRAQVNLEKLGLPIIAFMRIVSAPGQCIESGQIYGRFPQVLECHRVTGSDDYIMKVAVASVGDLERLIDRLPHHQITTMLVLSSLVTERIIDRPPA
ncbi:Lrp/AsnC family transcriptional regulator [Microcoleus sp. FACHB-1515]|uniref:Lrp/AsnC family transcriptional regulator n=1 Tax=Cyanophyceae TaxID=3028117 RepID=UPI0016872B58|nr:Lrp/AsnC family transcriptional regulator [Microcoleus sp. FACHB-1515]MBD2088509.1 Lrp/AsnC family transcriptional regulator [Microcoleus sp. FACHB-1515]